jgi:hypothetical protein
VIGGGNGNSEAKQDKGVAGKAISCNLGHKSTPPKLQVIQNLSATSMVIGECSRAQCKPVSEASQEISVLNSAEDRVQGLSGNNMIYSEKSEDILSEGAQGSRSNDPVIKDKQREGNAICFTSKNQVYENINTEGVMDGSAEDDQNCRESTSEGKGGELVPYVEVARKGEGSKCVMAISEHQKILDTR